MPEVHRKPTTKVLLKPGKGDIELHVKPPGLHVQPDSQKHSRNAKNRIRTILGWLMLQGTQNQTNKPFQQSRVCWLTLQGTQNTHTHTHTHTPLPVLSLNTHTHTRAHETRKQLTGLPNKADPSALCAFQPALVGAFVLILARALIWIERRTLLISSC